MKNEKNEHSFKVLIPDGESPFSLSVIGCLGEISNITVIVFSSSKLAPIRFSRYCSKFIYYLEGNDDEERLNAIINKLEDITVDVILPVDVKTIRLFSKYKLRISKHAAIAPLPDLGSFDISNDKWLLALWLKQKNIPHPKTIQYDASSDFQYIISSMSYPLIFKPRLGSGGVGIEVFDHSLNLKSFLKDIKNYEDFIIQSYINGYDIDCSVLCEEGKIIAHTIQKGFNFDPHRIAWPSGVEFLEDDILYGVVVKLVENFNWTGLMHIDMRYDEDKQQFKVIEINPRFWASVQASGFAGVNFPYLTCLLALKKEIPEIVIKQKRVVRSKPAFKMLVKRIFYRSKQDVYFDNTYLEYIIKDPLPNIYKMVKKIF